MRHRGEFFNRLLSKASGAFRGGRRFRRHLVEWLLVRLAQYRVMVRLILDFFLDSDSFVLFRFGFDFAFPCSVGLLRLVGILIEPAGVFIAVTFVI